jgi:hypothetical protein
MPMMPMPAMPRTMILSGKFQSFCPSLSVNVTTESPADLTTLTRGDTSAVIGVRGWKQPEKTINKKNNSQMVVRANIPKSSSCCQDNKITDIYQ